MEYEQLNMDQATREVRAPRQQSLERAIKGPNDATFDGEGQGPEDHDRLRGQMLRLYNAMKDGQWYTLAQLSELTGDPESSCSANFRSFRKEKFGAFQMDREKEHGGLHWYRMGIKGEGDPNTRQAITPNQELALRAADELIPYMRHKPHCRTVNATDPQAQCDCRLDAVRSEYRVARQQTRA